ncbi:MAG: hypothetical protein GY941_22330 [Planctomycetes bacterium]|nr:hypothetical protein [Planctomycetota bacterium]
MNDNNTTLTITVPTTIVQHGITYRATGEYRQAKTGEYYWVDNKLMSWTGHRGDASSHSYPIYKPERSRAANDSSYFYVGSKCRVLETVEDGNELDADIFNAYNYFHTEEQAQQAAKLVKATLKQFSESLLS